MSRENWANMFKLPEKTNPFLFSSRIVPIGTHIHTTTTHHCERNSWIKRKRKSSVKWNLPCGSVCEHVRRVASQLPWRTLCYIWITDYASLFCKYTHIFKLTPVDLIPIYMYNETCTVFLLVFKFTFTCRYHRC